MTTQKEPRESNIVVVVRIRPHTDKDSKDADCNCVCASGGRNREVVVRTGASESFYKTYTFDRVLGPESTQKVVFEDVVSPMLKEVLLGYNCTIFAYGQTGTGKTYTMEGDLSERNSPGAGIIPRTLRSLFEILDKNSGEWSVRVSCMELYQEELKDLLSPDEDNNKKLKLFEDYNRKGSIFVQGLEETLVKNVDDVMETIQKSSYKRQTAATKLNGASSRSHCIFCITARIRETNPEGEELVKVGKLNLVDLAGSENIGRSGAENRRAREAGAINQSLLTLGRVINSLVERSPHIPYRESKLTRLLQDSLGGKTKTCIIAAISPERCNIEETMSTLDYAHRAKNIRNKPEINQKMNKRVLLREYEEQIERLKYDLLATREKSGIYMNVKNYQDMVSQCEKYKVAQEELARALEAKEDTINELKLKLDNFDDNIKTKSSELEAVKAALQHKNGEIEAISKQRDDYILMLKRQEGNICNEKVKVQRLTENLSKFEESNRNYNDKIASLKRKLDDKNTIQYRNAQTFGVLREAIINKIGNAIVTVDSFKAGSNEAYNGMIDAIKQFIDKHQENVELGRSYISEKIRCFSNFFDSFYDHATQNCDKLLPELEDIKAKLDDACKCIDSYDSSSSILRESILENSQSEMLAEVQKILNIYIETHNALKEFINKLGEDISSYIEDNTTHLQNVINAQESEIDKINKENKQLELIIKSNKQIAEEVEANMAEKVISAIKDYSDKITKLFDDAAEASSKIFENRALGISSCKDKLENLFEKGRDTANSIVSKIDSNNDKHSERINEASLMFTNVNEKMSDLRKTACDKLSEDTRKHNIQLSNCIYTPKKACMEVISIKKSNIAKMGDLLNSSRCSLENTLSEINDKIRVSNDEYKSSYSYWVNKTFDLKNITSKACDDFNDALSEVRVTVDDTRMLSGDFEGIAPGMPGELYPSSRSENSPNCCIGLLNDDTQKLDLSHETHTPESINSKNSCV